tara:strand:+ start:1110 stop:1919 length:810 start_codon:yes stop_codon:yes gene_type:complete
MAMRIRKPVVAGAFYPLSGEEIKQMWIEWGKANFDDERVPLDKYDRIHAIVSPHAGYMYSGEVASRVYSLLERASKPSHVLLLGPSHHVYLHDIAAPSVTHFETPLGQIALDEALIAKLAKRGDIIINDAPHLREHSLEVQLPLIQLALDSDIKLVPLVVGDVPPERVSTLLDSILEQHPDTLVIVSTDLSHFHSYGEANLIDQKTTRKIIALDTSVEPQEACGCRPLNGLLLWAREKHLDVDEVARCNSGDTAGTRDRVVGYGAYVVH